MPNEEMMYRKNADSTYSQFMELTGSPAKADGSPTPVIPPMMYNGSTYDIQRANLQGTLLPSASRTSTTVSATQTNYNHGGILLTLNVTAASGTGGLIVRIYTIDPVSGATISLNAAPTAVTANGTTTYLLYPGALNTNTTVTQIGGGALPRTFYVQVTHGDASSYTYSVGYQMIL